MESVLDEFSRGKLVFVDCCNFLRNYLRFWFFRETNDARVSLSAAINLDLLTVIHGGFCGRNKCATSVDAALKEFSSPLRCFTFAFDGKSPLGWASGGGRERGGDVLQDLLERPFVLVSASGGGEI